MLRCYAIREREHLQRYIYLCVLDFQCNSPLTDGTVHTVLLRDPRSSLPKDVWHPEARNNLMAIDVEQLVTFEFD